MNQKTSSPFNLKRSDGKLTGFAHLALRCLEIDLACPWFIVAAKIRNDQLEVCDRQYLSFSAEKLSKLLDVLSDIKEERQVYVVTAVAHDPSNGMKIDRLHEIWRAIDAKHPLIATMTYVLDDGNQFSQKIDCIEPVESLGESRLLVRV